MPKQSFSTSKRFSVPACAFFCMSSLTGALSVDKCLFIPSLVFTFRASRNDSLDWAQMSAFHSRQDFKATFVNIYGWGRLCPWLSLWFLCEASWGPRPLHPAEIRLVEHWIHVCCRAADSLRARGYQCWTPVSRTPLSVRCTLRHFLFPQISAGPGSPKALEFMLPANTLLIMLLDLSIPQGQKKGQPIVEICLALIHSITTSLSFILPASTIISPVGWCLFHSGHEISASAWEG